MLVPGWQDIIDDQRKVQGQLFVKVLYRPYLEEDEGAGKRLLYVFHRHLMTNRIVTVLKCKKVSARFAATGLRDM